MKIIHAADIHLGSKIASKFPKEISDERKKELLASFSRLIQYAKDNDVKVILLSGDVFDKDDPTLKQKEFFYNAIKANPEIDFLYLKGNHDTETSYVEDIPNLKMFSSEEIIKYSYGNIDIYGLEMNSNNYKGFYSKLSFDKNRINILMLHGEVSDSSFGINKIRLDSLKNKNLDYLALGHIHSYSEGKIDQRARYAYPGCLEGRGFDECGDKGFVLLDIDETINSSFVKHARRTIHEINIDVSNCENLYEITELVKKTVNDINKDDILSIVLDGELAIETEVSEADIVSMLSSFYFVRVKNKTYTKINIDDYKDDLSLIGEFVRGVYSNENYSEEEKKQIVTIGLKLIKGREVD